MLNGIDTLRKQYKKSTPQSSSSVTKSQKEQDFINLLKRIPVPVYIAFGGIILVLFIIFKIVQFAKKAISTGSPFDHTSQIHNRSYYHRHSHRPPHNRSHRSSSRSSSRSSKSGGSSSSGSRRHR